MMLRSLEVGAKSKRKIELLSGWKHVCNQIKAKRFSESSFREFLKTDFNVFKLDIKEVAKACSRGTMSQRFMVPLNQRKNIIRRFIQSQMI